MARLLLLHELGSYSENTLSQLRVKAPQKGFLRARKSTRLVCAFLLATATILTQSKFSSKICLNQGSRVFYSNPTPRWSAAKAFIGADTVAEVLLDGDKISCRLTVIKEELDRPIVQKAFPKITEVDKVDMLKLVERCGEAEDCSSPTTGWALRAFLMYPGTLWCGPGDIASNYSELGTSKEVDRCCRNHDFCPLKIYGGHTRFGLRPNFLKAAMLCQCESAFDECLRRAEKTSDQAATIRRYYFDLYSPQCILDGEDGRLSLIDFAIFNKTASNKRTETNNHIT